MDKIDKLIETVRLLKEEGMGVGAVGGPTNKVGEAGLTGAAKPGDPLQGYDKVMGKMVRRKAPQIIGKGTFPGARTRWRKGLK